MNNNYLSKKVRLTSLPVWRNNLKPNDNGPMVEKLPTLAVGDEGVIGATDFYPPLPTLINIQWTKCQDKTNEMKKSSVEFCNITLI